MLSPHTHVPSRIHTHAHTLYSNTVAGGVEDSSKDREAGRLLPGSHDWEEAVTQRIGIPCCLQARMAGECV